MSYERVTNKPLVLSWCIDSVNIIGEFFNKKYPNRNTNLPIHQNSIGNNNEMRSIIPLELHKVSNQCHYLHSEDRNQSAYNAGSI